MGAMSVSSDDDRLVELTEDMEILPDQTRDDTDEGWGDWRESGDDDSHLIEERPPHW
ncbi:MAG: hypothetical protein JWO67_382 [Streptosporangiaceae bacterium]|jgi:hypothetical protein|nr:hypothetical protein [Streptosporangiaceae bacterium]